MPPFLSLGGARSFCLLHPRFRIHTEDQPHRHLVAICQLQNHVRDLSWIAFPTPLRVLATSSGTNRPWPHTPATSPAHSERPAVPSWSEYLPAPVCRRSPRTARLP